jgi:hypothetical protein
VRLLPRCYHNRRDHLPPFLGCNPAYSSRPLTQVIGDRVDTFAVTCGEMFPL